MRFSEKITKNTLVDYPRLHVLSEYVRETSPLGGRVAEVGVYKGGTAYLIASLTLRPVDIYDTFIGMPPVSEHDLHHEGDFSDTSLEQVSRLLHPYGHVHIMKGLFPASADKEARSAGYSLVHLDVDIYTSVRDCLEFFEGRMLPGGVIILDDYLEPNCPGAKLATDEFCLRTGRTVVPTCQSQAMIQF